MRTFPKKEITSIGLVNGYPKGQDIHIAVSLSVDTSKIHCFLNGEETKFTATTAMSGVVEIAIGSRKIGDH